MNANQVLAALVAEYGTSTSSMRIGSKRRNLWTEARDTLLDGRDNTPSRYCNACDAVRYRECTNLLDAAIEAERLLDSVAFVAKEGDTDKPLRMLRAAIADLRTATITE